MALVDDTSLEIEFEQRLRAALGGATPVHPLALLVLRDLLRLRRRLAVLLACERAPWFQRLSLLRIRPTERLAAQRLAAVVLGRGVRDLEAALRAFALSLRGKGSMTIDDSLEGLRRVVDGLGQLCAVGREGTTIFRSVLAALDLFADLDGLDGAAAKLGKMSSDFYQRRTTPDILFPPHGRRDEALSRFARDLDAVLRWNRNARLRLAEVGCGNGRVWDALVEWQRRSSHTSKSQWRLAQWDAVVPGRTGRSDLWELEYHGIDIEREYLEAFAMWADTVGRGSGGFQLLVEDSQILYTFPPGGVAKQGDMVVPREVQADIVLVPNVLHEIRLHDLPGVLDRIEQMLAPGGTIVFIEQQSLKNVEDQYALWDQKDFWELLSGLGFIVFAVSNRSARGTPLTIAYASRRYDEAWGDAVSWRPPTRQAIARACQQSARARQQRMVWEIADLSRRRKDGLSRLEAYRHFHFVHSLTNLLRESLTDEEVPS